MNKKRLQRKVNRRLMTIIAKIEQLEEMSRDGADVPFDLRNKVNDWYGWLSDKESQQ